MTKHAAIIVFALLAGGSPLTSQTRQTPSQSSASAAAAPAITAVLAAYRSGDDQAVQRWLGTADGRFASRHALTLMLNPDDQPTRTDVAFLLEVMVARDDREQTSAFAQKLRIAAARLPSPSADPDRDRADRFDMIAQQIVLALLPSALQFFDVQPGDAGHRGMRAESRLPLTRAMVAGAVCCKQLGGAMPGPFVTEGPATSREAAVALFEEAAREPSLHDEALVRGAVLLYRQGQIDRSREWLARVSGAIADPVIAFMRDVTLGRVLDARGLAPEAAVAYQAATRNAPDGSIAHVGLAAALLRSGRGDEAMRMADRVLRAAPFERDPLDEFESGDKRFVPAWLIEARGLRK